ncbi:MAG: hypothetical protein WC655_26220 [Candidatus Hydrogenedentales bacterium]|jgi:hypothetical protein
MQNRSTTPTPVLSEATVGQHTTEAGPPEVSTIDPPSASTESTEQSRRKLSAAYLGAALHATRMAQQKFLLEGRKGLGNLALQVATDLHKDGEEEVRKMIGEWLQETSRIPLGICRTAVEQVDHETEDALSAIAEIEQMQAEIKAVVARLDPKPRGIVGSIQSLAWLEGVTNTLSWAQDEVNAEGLGNWKVTGQCLRTAKDDPDVATMAKVFDLIRRVRLAVDYEGLRSDAGENEDPAEAVSRIESAETAHAISEAVAKSLANAVDQHELRAAQA